MRFTRTFAVSYILILGILLIRLSTSYNNEKLQQLSLEDTTLPVVSMSEVNNTEDLLPSGYQTISFPEITSVYWTKENFFSPINIESLEDLNISVKLDNGKEDRYNPTCIRNKVYQLRFKFMADKIVKDYIKVYKEISQFKKIDNPNFDSLYLSESSSDFTILASRGHGVIYLHYFGNANINEIINTISSKLELLECD